MSTAHGTPRGGARSRGCIRKEAPMAKRKSAPIPVVVDGLQVGSLRLRYRTWQFRFRANGIHREVTLRGVRDLEAALHRARVLAAQAPPTPIVDPLKHSLKPRTMLEALQSYEEQYTVTNRRSSAERTMPMLRAFIGWLGCDRPPYCLTRQHVIAYRDLRAQSVSRATVNSDLQRIKAFANWLRAEQLVDGDPCCMVKKLKVATIAKRSLPPEIVTALMRGFASNEWLLDYTTLLLNTGLRPQEGLRIRACDVDVEHPLLHVRAYEGWEIKDNEDRTLALNHPAYAALLRRKQSAASEEAPVFAAPKGGAWDYRRFVSRVWRPMLVGHLKGIAPYALRHYFASQAVAKGWSIEKLSRYLGHQSITTTQRYYVDMRSLTETGAPPIVTDLDEKG